MAELYDPRYGALAGIQEKYPMFSDIVVADKRDMGIQNGRKLEFTEAYDDRVDSPLIEIFDPALQGDELEQAIIGEYLHEAPRRSPEYANMRSRLNDIKTPEQLQDDVARYNDAVENYGETRPYDKWMEVSGLDAFIRGYAVGQWPENYYTDLQKQVIASMMQQIKGAE